MFTVNTIRDLMSNIEIEYLKAEKDFHFVKVKIKDQDELGFSVLKIYPSGYKEPTKPLVAGYSKDLTQRLKGVDIDVEKEISKILAKILANEKEMLE